MGTEIPRNAETKRGFRKEFVRKPKGKVELKDRVIVLEGSLRKYQNRNSAIELKASLSKIEEMKQIIEELEMTLQNCENRIKHLEANENRNKEQLHYFQNQVRSRDHIMEEAVDMDQRMERLEQSQKEMQEQLQKQMNEQQKMIDKMMESQGSMMAQLTQWFNKGIDKGKGSVLNVEEGDNEGPVYPPDFTPQQVEIYPRKSSVTIRPQQF
ncbi:uncharacterized protein [Gossypium hirsutum]|uniref:Uncharacterized protein n=1 Tax=Gossypium hirsutum TaxID=3635 RepID=A0ABM3BBT8_GOSHI|nr:uncharacterized protein LOC121224933 [Gossypium hirsutum]